MTFLNPAVLFGLLAASIPIIIHLLNRRRLKKIEFSSLAFLKELQKNKIRRVKVKQWILLALRVLIILLLVTAFARPTLQGVAIGGMSSAVKTTAVFILDDTYSMSVIDEQGSFFNQSKALTAKHLNSLQDGDEAALLLVSAASKQDFQLSLNMKEISRQLNECRVSEMSGTLHEAISKAAALLGSSQNYNKELYIFTDMQKNRITRDSLHSDLGELLSKRVNMYLFPMRGKEPFNLAIDSMSVNSAILRAGKPVSVSVCVHNTAKTDSRNSVVSLFIDGERAAQKPVSLAGRTAAEIALEADIKHSGYNEITAALEDDDIAVDNRCFAAIDVPEKIPISIFEQEPGDGAYLNLALSADDSLGVFTIRTKPVAQLNALNSGDDKMIFIAGASKNINVERVKNYLTQGGGVFLLPGASTSLDEYNFLLTRLGLPPAIALNTPRNGGAAFASLSFEHPLLRGIFARNEKLSVASPSFTKFFSVEPGGIGKSIVQLNSQSAFLIESKVGEGRLLYAVSAFLPAWNNFPYKAFFIPLLYRSAFYLALPRIDANGFRTGDNLPVDMRRFSGKIMKVVRPGLPVDILPEKELSKRGAVYANTTVTGCYKFFANDKPVAMIPVNHEPEESLTEIAAIGDFKDYLHRLNAKANLTEITDGQQSLEIVRRARFGVELWKWAAIAALLIALLEMWIAKSGKQDMPGT